MYRSWIVVVLALWVPLAPPAIADESARIQKLEAEVESLRLLVQDMRDEYATGPDAVPREPSRRRGPRLALPELSLAGFSHVQYEVSGIDRDAGGRDVANHFTLGDLDLFLVAGLSEKFSVFAELLFHFTEQEQNSIEVARLMLKYDHADWLAVTAGRTHTPVGYWNISFGHPTWLQTTVERPLLYTFENRAGILPLHTVGLELSGHVATSVGTFGYLANVGNGRGLEPSSVQITKDLNQPKMLSLMATFEPPWLEGLTLGANGYFDRIPDDPGTPGREAEIDEFIGGGFVAFQRDPYEVLIEGQVVRHDPRQSNQTWYSGGGYAQLAYRIGSFKPYYRFDLLEVDDADVFFAEVPDAEDTTQHTLGVRYDWASFVAFKFELRRQLSQTFDSFVGVGQMSFAF